MIEIGVFLMCVGIGLACLIVACAHAYKVITEVNIRKRLFAREETPEEETDLEKRLNAFRQQQFGVPIDRMRSPAGRLTPTRGRPGIVGRTPAGDE
jgi:hypothetical protein